jgi:hypothetical protein
MSRLQLKNLRGVKLSSMTLALLLVLLVTMQTGDTYMFQPSSGVGLHTIQGVGRVAVVKPVFTATAYSSFYHFYGKHHGTPKGQVVTADVGMLDHSLVDGWGWSEGLHQFVTSKTAIDQGLVLGRSLTLLTDVSVHEGALFDNKGSNKFDVVILGFTEYVTSQQYYAYKHFVATGGRLVLLDATNFLAEVRYDSQTGHVSLVKGHGWSFDGQKAMRDVFDRWRDENTNWVASTFCFSGQQQYNGALVSGNHTISRKLRHEYGPRVFRSYSAHEENVVTNMTGTVILARWASSSSNSLNTTASQGVVAAYLHYYQLGIVIHIGVMSSDVIAYDKSVQAFLMDTILEYASVIPAKLAG